MNSYIKNLILFCWLAPLLLSRTVCGQDAAAPVVGADYLVIDLRTWEHHFTAAPPDILKDVCRTEELWLRRIPAGRFTMGSPEEEEGRDDDEAQHEVVLGEYFIAVFECTQAQWEAIMGENPSQQIGAARPVERISYDAIRGGATEAGWPGDGHDTVGKDSFLDKLRGKTGLMLDLPTEAQWEYACRAGETGIVQKMSDAGRFDGNTDDEKGGFKEHTTVGSYAPNGWGLYDMRGNVAEWCLDWYGDKYTSEMEDPVGPEKGKKRVLRGGSWRSKDECRPASRSCSDPTTMKTGYVGFRVAVICTTDKAPAAVAPPVQEMKTAPMQTAPTEPEVATEQAAPAPAPTEPEVATEQAVPAPAPTAPVAAPEQTVTELTEDVHKTIKDGGQDALYLVIDLSGGSEATHYPVRCTGTPPDLNDDTCRTTELWLRRIPAGTFMMGSPKDEIGRNNDDETQHEVTLTQDYYIDIFECTQRQWELVMGNRPSYFNNPDCYATRPVEQVSYNDIRGSEATAGGGWPSCGHSVDAASFMGRLQAKTDLTFDLPTEAQWEYACRAGTTTALNSGKNLSPTSLESEEEMNKLGRYWNNGGRLISRKQNCTTIEGTEKVGNYQPNAWGLYDMHGNVGEWCLDWFGSYETEAAIDPIGCSTGEYRLCRSGYWTNFVQHCRSAHRNHNSPDKNYSVLGFRPACLLDKTTAVTPADKHEGETTTQEQ